MTTQPRPRRALPRRRATSAIVLVAVLALVAVAVVTQPWRWFDPQRSEVRDTEVTPSPAGRTADPADSVTPVSTPSVDRVTPAATPGPVTSTAPSVTGRPVAVAAGQRWVDQLRPALAAQTGLAEADLDRAAGAAIGLPDYAPGVDGFLFPGDYTFPEGGGADAAAALLREMTGRFAAAADTLGLEAGAAALGLTPLEVVTVASIVEAEVKSPDDQRKAARAIYNRLAGGTPLGVETAYRYGRLMATGVPYDDGITLAEQQADTPYNVYRHPGLPASPIGNPGESALDAALHPADGDWIYWVTVDLDTWETVFTADYNEFLAAADRFYAWCDAHGDPPGCY